MNKNIKTHLEARKNASVVKSTYSCGRPELKFSASTSEALAIKYKRQESK